MSEEEKQMFNKMIYCNLINGEQALKFNRKYEDLQQKVEQLENIRKEAIEYVYKHIQEYDVDGTFTNLDEFDFIASPQTLLNILNKGDNNGK